MKYTFKKTGHYILEEDENGELEKVYEYFFYFDDGVEFVCYFYEEPNRDNEDNVRYIQKKHENTKQDSLFSKLTCEEQAVWYRDRMGLKRV